MSSITTSLFETETQKECPICMEVVFPQINCLVTECGHTFHTSCLLNNIIHNKFGCPYCRRELLDDTERIEIRRIEIPHYIDDTREREQVNAGVIRNWLTEGLDIGTVQVEEDNDISDDSESEDEQPEEDQEQQQERIIVEVNEQEEHNENQGEDQENNLEEERIDEIMQRENELFYNNGLPSPHYLAVELQRYGFYMIDYIRIILDSNYPEYNGIIADYNGRPNIDLLRESIRMIMREYQQRNGINQDINGNGVREVAWW